jgi:hypothetical protein
MDALMDDKLRPLDKAHIAVVALVRFLLKVRPEVLHQVTLVAFAADVALEGFLSTVEAWQVLLETIPSSERLAAHLATELLQAQVTLQVNLQVSRRTEGDVAQLASIWLFSPKNKKKIKINFP